MTPTSRHDDLEALSALYDGELDADAQRFALKRLGHDASWQQACGRWQMIGDAMRGEASSLAHHDLAARISAALQEEPAQPSVAPATRRGWGANWMKGALAASVAAAALFVARPLWQDDAPSAARPGRAIAVQPSSASPAAPPAAIASAPAASVGRVSERVQANEPPALLAAAEARPAPAKRVARARGADSSSGGRTESIAAAAAAPVADPFLPPGDIVTRPWPRAAVPGSPATGAYSASFGARPRPSFYPFEPPAVGSDMQPTPDMPQP